MHDHYFSVHGVPVAFRTQRVDAVRELADGDCDGVPRMVILLGEYRLAGYIIYNNVTLFSFLGHGEVEHVGGRVGIKAYSGVEILDSGLGGRPLDAESSGVQIVVGNKTDPDIADVECDGLRQGVARVGG